IGFVSEAVRTVVVERWSVDETAVCAQGEGAVRRAADEDRSQGVAIDVTIVGEHARRAHGQARVFRSAVAVVSDDGAGGAGRIVHRRDRDADGGGSAVGLT